MKKVGEWIAHALAPLYIKVHDPGSIEIEQSYGFRAVNWSHDL